jgi:hypothetical protein
MIRIIENAISSLTLGLKVTKSPSRNFTHRKLSNNIMNFPEFLFKFVTLILMDLK